MHFDSDTIAAISTPIGQGGIGIVRITGPRTFHIADQIFLSKTQIKITEAPSHSILYGSIVDPSNRQTVDEVLVSLMRSPRSYTKEDVVEINCHGGMLSVRRILEIVIAQGARLADPGEFTRRAFLNGRINLSQAEAVADIIAAKTSESMRIALEQLRGGLSEKLADLREKLIEVSAGVEAYLDFPEDEIEAASQKEVLMRLLAVNRELEGLSRTFNEARYFRDGLSVAIVGRPNVGKSSLLNTLLQKNRAIVTALPGTTRDIIEDYLNIKGLPIRITDTAGIRESDELVEKEGIRRSLEAIENADFVVAMIDGSEPLKQDDHELLKLIKDKKALIAINKSDLPKRVSVSDVAGIAKESLLISTVTGDGIEELKSLIFNSNIHNWEEEREGVVVTNIRHKTALDNASASVERAVKALTDNLPLELFSIEIRDALTNMGEIAGTVTTDDILDRIFSNFCIGK